MRPRPNSWNDLDLEEVSTATRLQETQARYEQQLADATKELTERLGMQGSLGSVSAGGVVVSAGRGVSVSESGVRKSTIETDGDVFIGSNIDNPATTSFSVFANAQVYNNEQMDEGDLLIGNNSSGFSNMKWDTSEGQFQFRFGTTITAYMDTDGTLKFLAGEIGGWEITTDHIQKLVSNVGIVLDSDVPQIRVGNMLGNYVIINGDGTTPGISSSNYDPDTAGFNIDANTGDAEFNNLTARGELKTFLLTSSNQMAVAGNIIVSKDAGKLGADVSSGATTVNFGKALTVGDWIKIQGPDDAGSNNLEWMLIGSLVSGTTYNVTRNVDGSGANGWLKDTPFVVIGASGDSRIELVAGASGSIRLITQGAAWNTQTIQAEMSTVAGAITAGGGNIKLNSSGIVMSNNAQAFKIRNAADTDNAVLVYADNNNVFWLSDQTAGQSVRIAATPADGAGYVGLKVSEGNPGQVQVSMIRSGLTSPDGYSFGMGGLTLWADKAGETSVFNENGVDTDVRMEGDTDTKLLMLDAGLDAIGMGGDAESGYKLKVTGDQKVTGKINIDGNQIRGSSSALNMRMATYTLANNATTQLMATTDPFAFCIITTTEGATAEFLCRGGIHDTFEVTDILGIYSNTAGTANSNNVYWSAGNSRYELENKRGATWTYYVFYFADA